MNTVPKEGRWILSLCMGKSAHGVITKLNTWLRQSGVEWTSNRLKAIRTAALQLRGGNRTLVIEIYQVNSIAYNHKTLIPKGPMGKVVENFLRARQPQAIRRWDACLRLYTLLRLQSLSHAQRVKAYRAITEKYPGQDLSDLSDWMFERAKELRSLLPKLGVPDIGRLKGFSACHREIPVPSDIRETAYAATVTSLLTSVWIPPSLQELNPCEDLRLCLAIDGAECSTAGHIAFIQEGGCKARVVAVPNAWCQWLFQPLHRALDRLIRRLPNSAVHDQNRGGFYLQEHLRDGVWCYDLSSATDRFPLTLQLAVLRGLGLETWASALDEISHGKWTFDGETISWGTGQPMGLYGSFPLFHLTHWLLLDLSEMAASVDQKRTNTYFVLGDDVVITDAKVARIYHSFLKAMAVPVSEQKSIHSNTLGEFAGFVATTTNQQTTVYRPYRYNGDYRKVHPLNLMYAIGSKACRISEWWYGVYQLFGRTVSSRLPDLTPLLPSDGKEGKAPPNVDSHLLGSLANRVAYDLPFAPSDEFATRWRTHRYLLLGQKERLNSSGFAPKNLNPEGIGKVERDDPYSIYAPTRIWADALMREAKERQDHPEEPSSYQQQSSDELNMALG